MLVGACVCEYVVTLVIHLKDISGISTCTQFQMYFVVPISLFFVCSYSVQCIFAIASSTCLCSSFYHVNMNDFEILVCLPFHHHLVKLLECVYACIYSEIL